MRSFMNRDYPSTHLSMKRHYCSKATGDASIRLTNPGTYKIFTPGKTFVMLPRELMTS